MARQDEVHLVAHQQGLIGLMETLNLLEVTCMAAAAAAAAAAACFVQLQTMCVVAPPSPLHT
jgi:hypothetical protein